MQTTKIQSLFLVGCMILAFPFVAAAEDIKVTPDKWDFGDVEVEVTFSPSGSGAHEAFLHIMSNALPPNNNLFLPLIGTGIGIHETKIAACLDDDPWPCFPDLDGFKFEGVEGEEVP